MAKIIPFLTHLRPPRRIGPVRMDRFSPYFVRPADFELTRVRPHQAYSYLYPFEPDAVASLAYYFDYDFPSLKPAKEYAWPALRLLKIWRGARRRGQLKGTIQNGNLVVVDSRNGLKRSTLVLPDPLKSAYIFCDQFRAFSAIKAHLMACLPEQKIVDSWLEAELAGLVSRGLMLNEGKSYLSLAILPSASGVADSQSFVAEKPMEIRTESLVQLGATALTA
jgi:hypothetical protein